MWEGPKRPDTRGTKAAPTLVDSVSLQIARLIEQQIESSAAAIAQKSEWPGIDEIR